MLEMMFPGGVTFISLLPFLMVLLGTVLQMTTGVGLGLIAGPFLLFLMEAPLAIQTAILLNLILTVVILPFEIKRVQVSSLKHLGLWACIGIPVGCIFLLWVNGPVLKLISGIVVLLAAFQLKFIRPRQQNQEKQHSLLMIGGGLSGAMTGALAIPGPVALWALLSNGMPPLETRATLRAYFFMAYSLAFLVYYFLIGISSHMLVVTLKLSPAVLGGIGAGFLLRRRVSTQILGQFLTVILFLMGVSLVVKGFWEL